MAVDPAIELSEGQTLAIYHLAAVHGAGSVRRDSEHEDRIWFRTHLYDWRISNVGRVVGFNDVQKEKG